MHCESDSSVHTQHTIRFSQSLLEVFTGRAVRGTQRLCIRVSELMQSADINVARVPPLTSSRVEPWLLDPPTCDTDLSKHRKTFTLAEELRQEAQKHIVTTPTLFTFTQTARLELIPGHWVCNVHTYQILETVRKSLAKGLSVFTAELTAILMCFESRDAEP